MVEYQGNYKKYSLAQLDEWIHDTLNSDDITPQEIYDIITKSVDEAIEYHKKQLTKSVELLSLLKGHRANAWEGYDDFESPLPNQYTEEEMDAMCEAEGFKSDKDKCREYNLREAEYYNKRAQLDLEKSKYYWDTDRNR